MRQLVRDACISLSSVKRDLAAMPCLTFNVRALIIVWCTICHRQTESDIMTGHAARYGLFTV
jgi:hypothetical protein